METLPSVKARSYIIHLVMLLQLILLLDTTVSQSIINTLPGYPGALPFKLETGYIGIGETEDVQLFYYFVESERNPKDDPLMLWLAGGPGCSALRAFFFENGPLTFDYENSSGSIPTLVLNPYSWTKVANIIFIDQPVGTGFSYAKTLNACRTSDTHSAAQTYDFLRKWLMNHPEFLENPLYVSGDSYSGITIPIIVQEIYQGNEVGNEPPMNIAGYMIGNPVTDKNSDVNSRVKYAHRMTLLSDELYESAKANCHDDFSGLHSNDVLCGKELEMIDKCIEDINFVQILEPLCDTNSVNTRSNLLKWGGSSLQENSKPWCRSDNYVYLTIWARDKTVQEALQIREWERCNTNLFYSYGKNESISYLFNVLSSVEYHRNLLNKTCRALIYSGDHDMVIPHVGTEKWIHSLNLTVERIWEPWFVGGQVAGYSVSFSHNNYSLTYATVKGAGHTGPEYKPVECLAMVDRWFSFYPL